MYCILSNVTCGSLVHDIRHKSEMYNWQTEYDLTMMPLLERTAFHIHPSRSSVVLGPDLRRELPFTSRVEKLLSCHKYTITRLFHRTQYNNTPEFMAWRIVHATEMRIYGDLWHWWPSGVSTSNPKTHSWVICSVLAVIICHCYCHPK